MYPRSNKKTKTCKKKVSFHHTAFVVLIPTVDEYHNAGLSNLLWWNDCDFHSFKVSAADEVKDHMKSLNVNLDAKSALKIYFQQFFNPEDINNTQHNLQLSYEMLTNQRQQLLESLSVEQPQQPQPLALPPAQASKAPVMIPMPIAQRNDSITASKFHHHQPQQQPQSMALSPQSSSSSSSSCSSANVVTPLRPPSPPSTNSCEKPALSEGNGTVDLAVLARMVAMGFFVLINRN